MKQLDIEFFFPLTEQIPLDLDFTRCKEYEEAKRAEMIANSTTYITSGNGISIGSTITTLNYASTPYANSVGAIEVTPDFHVYVKTKPNWLARFSMKKIFGWNWKDK
jgi:hypothetical protein